MVVGCGADGDGVKAGGDGFRVAQASAGGDQVEHLDDLRAEAAGKGAVVPERVLTCDPSLLVCCCAERQVGLAEQPVMSDDAVAGREDVR